MRGPRAFPCGFLHYYSPAMLIARTLAELRASTLPGCSLVPTMGALHRGHLALVAAARAAGAPVVASLFVNPLQFDQGADFARYPRTEEEDFALLAEAGCAMVWAPEVATMYPPGAATTITVEGPAEGWEGAYRPGHFRGVATVVAKLFGQVRPARAFFGEKDWQQLQVIRRLTEDLLLPVAVLGVATVREPDGLALSSRNRFLSPEERVRAPLLFATLADLAVMLADGRAAALPLAAARERLAAVGFAPDYLALVEGASLREIPAARPGARLIVAARLGSVRLLDNVPLTPAARR